MQLIHRLFRRANHERGRFALWMRELFYIAWPAIWPVISWVDAALPNGRLRRGFRHIVFTRPWRTFHRSAYIPRVRDLFFEYIATYSYEYPIRRGDVVVQVGASFGEETARFVRAVGKTGRVIAIEPAPENLKRQRATFRPDVYPQVTIVPIGAWKARGQLPFFLGGEKEHRLADLPGDSLTYDWWGVKDHLDPSRYKGQTTIPVDRVENILRELGVDHADFVLVETNGSELEAVEGIGSALGFMRQVNARGHVERDGVPIYHDIAEIFRAAGFETTVNSEGMVVAHRPGRSR